MYKYITKFLFIIGCVSFFARCTSATKDNTETSHVKTDSLYSKDEDPWQMPDTSKIADDDFGAMVKYGRKLILNTAYYIGPNGTVSKNLGNKMNCTNCHLNGGTKPYAFNYISSHARYPQYRARENKILTLSERVNNCIERPHNGKPLKLDSKEMTAIVSYIKWLGENVPVNQHVEGDSPVKLILLNRAADPAKGETVYIKHCLSCHGKNGEGKMNLNNVCYEYPPLWGDKSYQCGSSMHRVHKAASFIYTNMPHKIATYLNPVLTMEEAFDVAAFINDDRIHKRPKSTGIIDYPNSKFKAIDYGTAPFIDSFPELQHKFGPWQVIIDYRKDRNLLRNF